MKARVALGHTGAPRSGQVGTVQRNRTDTTQVYSHTNLHSLSMRCCSFSHKMRFADVLFRSITSRIIDSSWRALDGASRYVDAIQ